MFGSDTCDFCERTIPPGSAVCPNCGRPQTTVAESRAHSRSLLLAILLAVVVFVGWAKFAGFAPVTAP
jgi:hypothetical protein